MFNKIKKSELTRVESLTLSIAQWCILDLLPEEKKNRNVFFTQVEVTTVKKLKNSFLKEEGDEYKSIQLKAFFTTLEESAEYGREGMTPSRPNIEGEFLFKVEGAGCYIWSPSSFSVNVFNLPDIIAYPNVGYHTHITGNDHHPLFAERKERFEEFFKKLSHNAPWGAAVMQDI